MDQPQ
jgi:DDE_Tnp_1-associated